MVILADDIFLGADIEAAEHALQKRALIRIGNVHCDFFNFRRFPHGFQLKLGHAFVHEAHGHGGHNAVIVAHFKKAGLGKGSQGGGFHVHAGGQGQEFVQLGGRHGQGHAFLRFGKQNFPRAQAIVFQGSLGNIKHAAARVFGHFAHG